MNSATSALHIACLALGVGSGDLVWTSPITFVASANCARYCGADIDFVDIDSKTFNLCSDALLPNLKWQRQGKTTKVVIPVHFAGQPCDMEAIHRLSKAYGFRIIEDASHAIGARYQDTRTGDCTFSDITIFSFHPVKIITTAEGACHHELRRACSKDAVASIARDHPRKVGMVKPDEGVGAIEQQMLGFNYRMTELQAALGLSQLQHLMNGSTQGIKSLIATIKNGQFANNLPGTTIHFPFSSTSLSDTSPESEDSLQALRASGIGVNVHYIPVHMQTRFSRTDSKLKSASFPKWPSVTTQTVFRFPCMLR